MINLSMRTKAALLAFTIAASTNNTFCSQPAQTTISAQIGTFIKDNKILLSTLVGLLVAGEICLSTDSRVTYSYDNWTEDVKEFLGAYNVFNSESRVIIKQFMKKYFIGARIRLDDVMIRTKEENGSVVTVKRKKISQKPSGVIGLLDAYVLSQMKPITDFITPAVTFYVLITNPELLANKEMKDYPSDNKEKGSDAAKETTPEQAQQALKVLVREIVQEIGNAKGV